MGSTYGKTPAARSKDHTFGELRPERAMTAARWQQQQQQQHRHQHGIDNNINSGKRQQPRARREPQRFLLRPAYGDSFGDIPSELHTLRFFLHHPAATSVCRELPQATATEPVQEGAAENIFSTEAG